MLSVSSVREAFKSKSCCYNLNNKPYWVTRTQILGMSCIHKEMILQFLPQNNHNLSAAKYSLLSWSYGSCNQHLSKPLNCTAQTHCNAELMPLCCDFLSLKLLCNQSIRTCFFLEFSRKRTFSISAVFLMFWFDYFSLHPTGKYVTVTKHPIISWHPREKPDMFVQTILVMCVTGWLPGDM